MTKVDREHSRHYIPAGDDEIHHMLASLGMDRLDQLFDHIPKSIRMAEAPNIGPELEYNQLLPHLKSLAAKNNIPQTTFAGDGLPHWRVQEIVPWVCAMRGLTTAYTPYQPERSQGTLATHWIYQCALAALTGFEAINASMYDRATCLYEAACTALRMGSSQTNTVLVYGSIYPGDRQVLQTMATHTAVRLEFIEVASGTGIVEVNELRARLDSLGQACAGVVFPQVNYLGLLEDVDSVCDLCTERNLVSIAVIDPMLLGQGGLKPPTDFGTKGARIFVAEGQHLAIAPNFGGPGLGIFGIRFDNTKVKEFRSTPGRFVGKAADEDGNVCQVLVASTREQHIKRERATSNICSNEAFIATAAGASLLQRGAEGLADAAADIRRKTARCAARLMGCQGVSLIGSAPFFNSFTLSLPEPTPELLIAARSANICAGTDATGRLGNQPLLRLCFSDLQTEADVDALCAFFEARYGRSEGAAAPAELPAKHIRQKAPHLPRFSAEDLKNYYEALAEQNISPDAAIYPLGSCTMKYNPEVNDTAAALAGFAELHPQSRDEDCQGSLQMLYEIQEMMTAILGLKGVVTQAVAGAQGELVGLKMIQAYHHDHGGKRDILLIPRSAHGTNPATATVAGFETVARKGELSGIVLVESDPHGRIDMGQFKALIAEHGDRIAGMMVTNPNTSGIFEVDFKEMADLIHSVGGLVYMDGANMNAIAGWLDLGAMGVDAVHNNTHKTWSIPHGGGGPGDAIVGVSDKLLPYMPGIQVEKDAAGIYRRKVAPRSIGHVHRHLGNFAHKVRLYTYLKRLGSVGVRRMSAMAVLSSRYLFQRLSKLTPVLPVGSAAEPRMHEFILTIRREVFTKAEAVGLKHAEVIPRIGKLFLDYGYHAPTVAFPEVFGLMIEPTESYTQAELDRFADAVESILKLAEEHPEVLKTTPHFTPIRRVDDVTANRQLVLSEVISQLPEVRVNRISPAELQQKSMAELTQLILTQVRA